MNKYSDIINYNYVMKHKRMTKEERAFQFAPFSALTGYNELIKEKGRETSKELDLSDSEKDTLDYKFRKINSKISLHPQVIITYFIKDKLKDGGSYKTITDYIKKIDFYHKFVIFECGEKIKIDNIINIESNDVNLSDFFE